MHNSIAVACLQHGSGSPSLRYSSISKFIWYSFRFFAADVETIEGTRCSNRGREICEHSSIRKIRHLFSCWRYRDNFDHGRELLIFCLKMCVCVCVGDESHHTCIVPRIGEETTVAKTDADVFQRSYISLSLPADPNSSTSCFTSTCFFTIRSKKSSPACGRESGNKTSTTVL